MECELLLLDSPEVPELLVVALLKLLLAPELDSAGLELDSAVLELDLAVLELDLAEPEPVERAASECVIESVRPLSAEPADGAGSLDPALLDPVLLGAGLA
ncbi:MAG: hypothetical protein QOF99_887, partial [Pseudonocardiales bacterium]|nr:hypothetical protein [Pseudonocardiales bacterium]